MPYYQGDFYPGRGDFYRGDPGFFSFLGRAAKAAVGFIPGVGPVASKAIDVGTAIIKRAPTTGVLAQAGGLVKGGTAAVARTVMKHPIVSAAAGAGVIGAMSGGIAGRATAPALGVGQRGYHVSRKTGRVVRNRHMNPCNPRALRRAIRRTHRFAKLAMHTIHLVHPKKKARFGGFKRKRKAA